VKKKKKSIRKTFKKRLRRGYAERYRRKGRFANMSEEVSQIWKEKSLKSNKQ
jgi:hypothetical protein